jgi:hypothetical protein
MYERNIIWLTGLIEYLQEPLPANFTWLTGLRCVKVHSCAFHSIHLVPDRCPYPNPQYRTESPIYWLKYIYCGNWSGQCHLCYCYCCDRALTMCALRKSYICYCLEIFVGSKHTTNLGVKNSQERVPVFWVPYSIFLVLDAKKVMPPWSFSTMLWYHLSRWWIVSLFVVVERLHIITLEHY